MLAILDPYSDRLDYGQMLRPPKGFSLDFAIGTTYSLDIQTAIGCLVPLGIFNDDIESIKDPLMLLRSLQTVSDKTAIFFQQGSIHPPSKTEKYFPLIDRILYPVKVQTDTKNKIGMSHGIFHPKMWILKYSPIKNENNGETSQFRVIVMSKNLTIGRDWEIGICLDGKRRKGTTNSGPLIKLLEYLMDEEKHGKNALPNDKRKRLKEIMKDLEHYQFDSGIQGFKNLEFVITNVSDEWNKKLNPLNRKNKPGDISESLIISPFLSNSILWNFAGGFTENSIEENKHILISRPVAIQQAFSKQNELKDKYKTNFILSPLITHEEIVTSIDEINPDGTYNGTLDALKTDIHAKLFCVQNKEKNHLFLGSLNATHNAFHNNVETVIKAESSIGPIELFKNILNKEVGKPDFLCEYRYDDYELTEIEREDVDLVFDWILFSDVTADCIQNDNSYSMRIEFPSISDLLDPFEVQIRPWMVNDAQKISERMEFHGLNITDLSDLFVVSIHPKNGDSTILKERIFKWRIPALDGEIENRDNAIVSGFIDNDENKFFRYVRLFLQEDGLTLYDNSLKTRQSRSNSNVERNHTIENGLLEDLMLAASRNRSDSDSYKKRIDMIHRIIDNFPTDENQDDKLKVAINFLRKILGALKP